MSIASVFARAAGPLALCGLLSCAAAVTPPVPVMPAGELEAALTQLKTATAALVAAAPDAANAAVDVPPLIWRVAGGIQSFRECADCPEMVVVPAGSFTMGSLPGERFRAAETPRRVTIRQPFAVSKFEITFAEWEACVRDGGCGGHVPGDEGWGKGRQPIINVHWEDASAYAAWLSRKTGKTYRLLSEAEWEYAARAGTTTPYSFGAQITSAQVNFDASSATPNNPAGLFRMKTVAVGSFPANAFGLHDMHGNAWEWVEDCWNDEYTAEAPRDGSAWLMGSCAGRVLRGGSWEDYAGDVRAAARVASNITDATWSDGIRIARTL